MHGFADACANAHHPPTHPQLPSASPMTFPVTEPQLLYHESELKTNKQTNVYFKTCFKSENVDDGKSL